MNQKIVVVMGGPSSEAEVSRRTGKAVLDALTSEGCNAVGLEFDPKNFAEDIKTCAPDVVFNAVHGAFGEDGRIQAVLELLGIPYTGSGVLASAVTMDKTAAKRLMLGEGISTPRSHIYRAVDRARDIAGEIAGEFSFPVVIKAASQGSSIGVVIVEEKDAIESALEECFRYGDDILVEEFISGKEITVAVLGDDKEQTILPIIEITTTSGRYDYESKYTKGASEHIIPARISGEEKKKAEEAAKACFCACSCRGVARFDMMLSADGTPFVIDINTVPGMTETSLVPDAARAVGISFGELCKKLVAMALEK
ncbi:MAG: D-alanine--D-alanine ligase [Schwartzia sp.]|nr:D-alanine--D-alanine ligase [Schwartzia sp. (in: firmicutes)]